MVDPFAAWSRLMSAGAGVARTARQAGETMAASRDVIAIRTGMIGEAMRVPFQADYRELARMVPEKVDAFSRAGVVVASGYWKAHAASVKEAQYWADMAMSGQLLFSGSVEALASHNVAKALGAVEKGVALGASALAPVHARATSNARRLKRRAKRG